MTNVLSFERDCEFDTGASLSAVISASAAATPPDARFLHPGEWAVGGAGDTFTTLLDSGVALVLWHPIMRIGGLCHFVLPRRQGFWKGVGVDGRYGNEAFDMLVNALADRFIPPKQCCAWLCGGARVPAASPDTNVEIDSGPENVAFGRECLAAAALQPPTMEIGGFNRRYLRFDLGSGKVETRQLAQSYA